MKIRVQDKKTAIELRKKGYSYGDIMKIINVSKGTLSHWLSDLDFSDAELLLITEQNRSKISEGRLKAAVQNTKNRMDRQKNSEARAQSEFDQFINEPFFAAGILMYWAEGAKKNGYFQFINSDPAMILLMVKWIEKYLNQDRKTLTYRLFSHKPYAHENLEVFWATHLGVNADSFQKTVYKPTPHTIKKNPDYKGCFRITIYSIDVLRRVLAWQKLIIKYYSTTL